MITISEAEEILKKEYHRDNFFSLINEILLPDYKKDERDVIFTNNIFSKVVQLGTSNKCDIFIFEVLLNENVQNRRVAITQEMFRILRGHRINNALVAFINIDGKNYRISLLTSKYEFDGDKIIKTISNPRRYSYYLGYGTKTNTAYKFLILKGKVSSLDDLIARFSVEVVNMQFYNEIALCFTKLVGGERDGKEYKPLLKIHGNNDHKKHSEFTVRLIGRIVFCWFLKEKKSKNNISLIPDNLLSIQAIQDNENYYHTVLEPLFFEILNTEQKNRKDKFGRDEVYRKIPYLNGGLFSPHDDDHYKYSKETESGLFGIVSIPDKWFKDLFSVFEQYNFTVDENTTYDVELSIDPEMLGRIFENLLAEINPETGESAKKMTGSFYTPREIVEYMVDNSLHEYLLNKTSIEKDKLKNQINYFKDNEIYNLSETEKKKIIDALYSITIFDPACGSGAFPIGMLQKIVYILQEIDPSAELWFSKAIDNILIKNEIVKKFRIGALDFIRKLGVIQKSIFGVDIQPIAVEISRLRCFLSLIIEEKVDDDEENRGINPLPNLEFKFVIANTLIRLEGDNENVLLEDKNALFEDQSHIEDLRKIRDEYFNANFERREKLKDEFKNIQEEMTNAMTTHYKEATSSRYKSLINWSPFKYEQTDWFEPDWMFGVKEGFNIIIGNPPYISTKGVSANDKKAFMKNYGFSDDTYNHFFFKGFQLLSEKGILNYISPKTFWTTQTKRNLRDLLLSKRICYIFDTANPFKAAMVDTCITMVQNCNINDNEFVFLDGSKDLANPKHYPVAQSIYQNTQNSVFFKPTDENMKIHKLYGQKVKELYNKWWEKISTSKNIDKNRKELTKYCESLKPGDIALLGCLTEGGVGLQTGNNGKYIAVRKSSKWANNIIRSRPKKLEEAIKSNKIKIAEISKFANITEYLKSLNEKEIAALFDTLKEKYGRDIFGQGYLYKLIDDNEIADVDSLTDDEKTNGISTSKKYYVPYDKGDKDGNRWYLETPFAIAWSKENVRFLKTDPNARYQGYMYFFREGFCWTDVNSTYLKSRIKKKGIFDVLSMSLFTQIYIPDWYFVCIINSKVISFYVDNFINNTSHFQINDARQLPIIIPTKNQLSVFESLFDSAYMIKRAEYSKQLPIDRTEIQLTQLQEKIDDLVKNLYNLV